MEQVAAGIQGGEEEECGNATSGKLDIFNKRDSHRVLMTSDELSLPSVPVSVMIFTLDEELNLPGCLQSLAWCDDVIVIDSFSHDRTEVICQAKGVRVLQHAFTGFGDQRNWALEAASPLHEWVLILDADERVPSDLAGELLLTLSNVPAQVGAFRLKRRFHLWGRWLRYSSLYPSWVVRLVRKGRVRTVRRLLATPRLLGRQQSSDAPVSRLYGSRGGLSGTGIGHFRH